MGEAHQKAVAGIARHAAVLMPDIASSPRSGTEDLIVMPYKEPYESSAVLALPHITTLPYIRARYLIVSILAVGSPCRTCCHEARRFETCMFILLLAHGQGCSVLLIEASYASMLLGGL